MLRISCCLTGRIDRGLMRLAMHSLAAVIFEVHLRRVIKR
jgi:hypothetical protein